jgi:hypothetical protein
VFAWLAHQISRLLYYFRMTKTTLPAERGIMFSKPMVEALLAGTKTQTRRALRPQPAEGFEPHHPRNPFGRPGDRLWVRENFVAFGRWETRHNAKKNRGEWAFVDMTRQEGFSWRFDGADPQAARIANAAPTWHPRPALFMPRAASRILLEIVDVRVERLQAVSAADAVAEGILRSGDGFLLADGGITHAPVLAYRGVWERINGQGSWDANPLVWVVGFRRLAS